MKRRDLLEALRTIVQLKRNLADEFGLEQRTFAYADVLKEIDSIQEMQGDLDGRIANAGREQASRAQEEVQDEEKCDSAQAAPIAGIGEMERDEKEDWSIGDNRIH